MLFSDDITTEREHIYFVLFSFFLMQHPLLLIGEKGNSMPLYGNPYGAVKNEKRQNQIIAVEKVPPFPCGEIWDEEFTAKRNIFDSETKKKE